MTTTVWNSGDKDASIALSTTTDTNDTATQNTTTGAWRSVRGTTGYTTTGKKYFEVKVSAKDASEGWIAGILNSQGSLTTFPGGDSRGCGYQSQGSSWTNAGNMVFGGPAVAAAAWIGIAVDFDNNKIWAKNVTTGSNWNNNGTADPVANVNGNAINAATITNGNTVYPAFGGFRAGGVADTAIINTGHGTNTFVGTIPSGYSAWDGGGGGGGGGVAKDAAVCVISG